MSTATFGGLRRFALLVVAALVASFFGSVEAHAAAPTRWCGDENATDRAPEAVAGKQIHVIYAYPSDAPDNFAANAFPIAADLAAIDAWWRASDPTRAPRFDFFAFPGCEPGFAGVDISAVRLPRDSSAYRAVPGRAAQIEFDLARTGFNDRGKKYLVYYDGPVDDPLLCGQSALDPDLGGIAETSNIYLQACIRDLGTGAVDATVAAHELLHNLGAVPPDAPHRCADNAHVCDTDTDIMFPSTNGDPLGTWVLDVGRDDYYGHSGSWWDVQDSAFLQHLDAPQFVVAVTPAGSGSGSVESTSAPGIQCPPACSIPWDAGSAVTLEASPSDDSRFVGWSGACAGAGPCEITVDSAKAVVATFTKIDRTPPRAKAVAASGSAATRRITLRYSVTDDSGRTRESIVVLVRGRRIAALTSRLRATGARSLAWRAPAGVTAFRFCVTASDVEGNTSRVSCAPGRLK